MADQEHFEGFDTERDEQSRTSHKREAQAIRKLADRLGSLGVQAFNSLTFPDEEIKEALLTARKMKATSDERRRQLQYVAKLLRAGGAEELQQQIDSIGATRHENADAMRLELLRTRLIEGGVEELNSLMALIPDLDRSKLRALIKKAKAEAQQVEAEKPQTRALFKYLKSEIKRSGASIPDELLRA